jgi:CRP-like cAMP-binding protein
MHWKVRREFLSRLEIFSHVKPRDLKALAKSCEEAAYKDQDTLCRQGERGVAAFLIVSGDVRVESETDDGRSFTVAELGQGAMVGELSVIDGAERVATVRAIGDVEALVITQWSMLALLKSRPAIAAAMLPIIIKRFRQTARELRHGNHESDHGRKSIYQ